MGGGFGGIAFGLRQQGHKVRVFERSDGPRTQGVGFDIQPCGYESLKQLGIWDKVIQPLLVDTNIFCKYTTTELTDATVDCFNGVSRPIEEFEQVDDKLDAELLELWNRINENGIFHIYVTKSVSLVFRPAGNTKFLWSLGVPRTLAGEDILSPMTTTELAEFAIQLLKQSMHPHPAALFSRAIWNTPMQSDSGDKPFVWYYKDIEPIPSYISKSLHCVLIGDAAHAMLPWTGLGANTAFEDAYGLVKLLETYDTNNDNLMDHLNLYGEVRPYKCELVQRLARESKSKIGAINFYMLKFISTVIPSVIRNNYVRKTALGYDADPLHSVAAENIHKDL